MLYLMMNKNENACLVKVGFSDGPANLKIRRKAYFSYNPMAIMRSSCAGNTAMEGKCRDVLLKNGGMRITGTEWFVVPRLLFDELYKKGMGFFHQQTHAQNHFLETFQ